MHRRADVVQGQALLHVLLNVAFRQIEIIPPFRAVRVFKSLKQLRTQLVQPCRRLPQAGGLDPLQQKDLLLLLVPQCPLQHRRIAQALPDALKGLYAVMYRRLPVGRSQGTAGLQLVKPLGQLRPIAFDQRLHHPFQRRPERRCRFSRRQEGAVKTKQRSRVMEKSGF